MLIKMEEDEYANFTQFEETNSTDQTTVANVCQPLIKEWGPFVTYKVTLEVFIVSILIVFGFVGNALSVSVLCRDQDRKNATNWLLQTLAVVDTIYLFTCLFIQTLNCIHDHTDWMPILDEVFPYLEPYIWAFGSIAQTATVWMVLLVTTDRYVAICKPLNTQLRSIKRAKMAVVAVAIMSILYNIPRFFERELFEIRDPCFNTTKMISIKTKFRDDPTYFLVYKTICYFVFRSIGPLVVLVFLNLQLISALRLVHRKQKEMTNRTKARSENITTMLVAVVTVFIICEIPDTILRIIYTIHIYTKRFDYSKLKYVNIITNMLLTINSSINFIIYCLIGKKFRKILHSMCMGGSKNGPNFEASETEPLTMKSTVNAHTMINIKNGSTVNPPAPSTGNKEDVPL